MLFWKLWDLFSLVAPEILVLAALIAWPRHFAKNPDKTFVFRPYRKLPPSEQEKYSFERLRRAEKLMIGVCILLYIARMVLHIYEFATGTKPVTAVQAVMNAAFVWAVVIILCAFTKFPLALFRKKQEE